MKKSKEIVVSGSAEIASKPKSGMPEIISIGNFSEEKIKETIDLSSKRRKSTERVYKYDWEHFTIWCQLNGAVNLPAEPSVVALWINDLHRGKAPRMEKGPPTRSGEEWCASTIRKKVAAIAVAHRRAGFPSPTQSELVKGAIRGCLEEQAYMPLEKTPVSMEMLRNGLEDATALEKAVVVFGFASAMRRSEISSIDLKDILIKKDGIIVTMKKGKTIRNEKRLVQIPRTNGDICPVKLIEEWIEIRGKNPGPLFLRQDCRGNIKQNRNTLGVEENRIRDAQIASFVKKVAEKMGMSPEEFAGHSLRAGYATTAAEAGVQLHDIMNQTGHKSANVAMKYIRGRTPMNKHPNHLVFKQQNE